jgi:hypothetical protein
MPGKPRLNRVYCSVCKTVVGHDSKIRVIDKCPSCHKGISPSKRGLPRTAASGFARTRKGPASDLPGKQGKITFRSAWERNFARVLTAKGIDWTYEQRIFTFSDYKKRPHQYVPDFIETESRIIWEVKGYLRSEDRSKMRRLKKNYPEDFRRMKACLSKSNKTAIAFYTKMGIPCTFIEDLRDQWRDSIPGWE